MGIIAKYKFNNTLADLLPEFNNEFTSDLYTVTDEVNGEVTTRTIESDSLPTLMRFGVAESSAATERSKSLLEIISLDISNCTQLYHYFRYCINLTTVNGLIVHSGITGLDNTFGDCNSLEFVDTSNWNTSNVTNMSFMFYNCKNLTTLDVSNWNTSNVTSMNDMFATTPKLTDIGMLNCNKSTIQKIVDLLPTDTNRTIWYKEANVEGITVPSHITLKKYMEENVEIVLNSPLLEGDRIEVKDGKLCHYHKMGSIILDGSEKSWQLNLVSSTDTTLRFYMNNIGQKDGRAIIMCPTFKFKKTYTLATNDTEGTFGSQNGSSLFIDISKSKLSEVSVNGFKKWLSENPTTIIYELASPYYEDITPLQSSLALRTFEECNIQIITALPIKTKITYRTNITSAIVMEQELDTLDSGVSLSNLIEEEVDE